MNQEFKDSGWGVYDEMLHRQAAISGSQQTESITLFTLLYWKGNQNGEVQLVAEHHNMTETCQVLREEDGLSQEERDVMGRSRRGGGHHIAALVRPWPICRNFNHGRCANRTCRYRHICLDCNGNHPRVACGSLSSLGCPTPSDSGPRQDYYRPY